MAAAMNMIAINQAHWLEFCRSRCPGNNNAKGNPARLAEAAARLQEVKAQGALCGPGSCMHEGDAPPLPCIYTFLTAIDNILKSIQNK